MYTTIINIDYITLHLINYIYIYIYIYILTRTYTRTNDDMCDYCKILQII